jgi:hypothetical protein
MPDQKSGVPDFEAQRRHAEEQLAKSKQVASDLQGTIDNITKQNDRALAGGVARQKEEEEKVRDRIAQGGLPPPATPSLWGWIMGKLPWKN